MLYSTVNSVQEDNTIWNHSWTFGFTLVLIGKDFVPEHHTLSINLDYTFHNLLSNREKTRVYSTLVCWEINLFLMRYFLRKLGQAQGRLPR